MKDAQRISLIGGRLASQLPVLLYPSSQEINRFSCMILRISLPIVDYLLHYFMQDRSNWTVFQFFRLRRHFAVSLTNGKSWSWELMVHGNCKGHFTTELFPSFFCVFKGLGGFLHASPVCERPFKRRRWRQFSID